MADYTQISHEIIAHQLITHPANLTGVQVVSTYLSGIIYVSIAKIETTANATGVDVYILGSYDATSNEDWVELRHWVGSTAVAETEAMTATEPIGETVMACASTTNLVVGNVIYLQDASVPADGEWSQIVSLVTNTSITLIDGLTTQKDSSDFIWGNAQRFAHYIPNLSGIHQIMVTIVHQSATGSNLHVKVESTWATDIE